MARGGPYVGYAKGGTSPGRGGSKWAILNERGFDETTITTDPTYRERNIGLWARVGRELGVLPSLQQGMISKALVLLQKASMAKTEAVPHPNVNVDMSRVVENQEKQISMMSQQIDALQQNIQLLQQLVLKDNHTYIDGTRVDQTSADRYNKKRYRNGGKPAW
ncbi:hypothetical protein B4067_4824 [Bacillus subtilis subsp. subtilis]|uniref:Uncharacterized protein n=3 Tax=Bacillus subtilis group TaxID=653685 RepID=A0ABD3ZPW8_BACIU|nr:hypothetical protein B4067_4824 [Bacillus subtilis subsp. subtilis]